MWCYINVRYFVSVSQQPPTHSTGSGRLHDGLLHTFAMLPHHKLAFRRHTSSAVLAVAADGGVPAERIIAVLTEQLCCVQEGSRGQGAGEKQLEALINIYKQTQVRRRAPLPWPPP